MNSYADWRGLFSLHRIDQGDHETKPDLSLFEKLKIDEDILCFVIGKSLRNSYGCFFPIITPILVFNQHNSNSNAIKYATLNNTLGSQQYLDECG